jgi:hypothetical protein
MRARARARTSSWQIARAAKDGNWSGRYNIHVGGYDEIEGDYGCAQTLTDSVENV